MKNDCVPLTVHLISRFGRGGAENSIIFLIGDQTRNNIIFSSGGEGVIGLKKKGISWKKLSFYPSNPVNIFISFFQLCWAVKKYNVELIHSHHRFTSLVGNMVARFFRIPFVCTVHDLAFGKQLFSRFAFGKNIIVYSQAVKSHLINHFGVGAEKIHLVTMGVDPIINSTIEQMKYFRSQAGCSLDTKIVCFSGRIVEEKGIDIFLKSVCMVLEKKTKTKFWIIGDGDLRGEMESFATSLGIKHAVTFWGWRNDVSLLMDCVDIVVVPSRREGFGKVALEALMLGKPVIATTVGGLPELVKHERNGLLVPPEDPNLIGEAILKLLDQKDVMVKMSKTALESVAGKYNIESMRDEINKVYCFAIDQQM